MTIAFTAKYSVVLHPLDLMIPPHSLSFGYWWAELSCSRGQRKSTCLQSSLWQVFSPKACSSDVTLLIYCLSATLMTELFLLIVSTTPIEYNMTIHLRIVYLWFFYFIKCPKQNMVVYNTSTLSSVDFVVRRALVIRLLVIYTVHYENSLTKLCSFS